MNKWTSCVSKTERDFYRLKIAPLDFCDANGYTRCSSFSYGTGILKKVLKSGTFSSFGWRISYYDEERVPYLDHALIYKNPKTKECALVYIPYLKGCKKEQDEIFAWAEKNGLKVMIFGGSWYHPETVVVIVTLPNVNVKAVWRSVFK